MRPTTREFCVAIYLLRCAELGIAFSDLDEMTVGMVFDMLAEKANDQEEYPVKATQQDFDAFGG